MKKLALIILAGSFSLMASAQSTQPRHIISVGTDGLGWSGLGRSMDWNKNKSGIKEHTQSEGKFDINYNFVFANRIMLGGAVSSSNESSELKDINGNKTKNEENEVEIKLLVGYNFNEDVFNSWWIQGGLVTGKNEQLVKDAAGKEKFDYRYTGLQIGGGKRINLDGIGLKNVSYNPSLSLASVKVSGDAKDDGLDNMVQLKLDLIKFDILF